MTHLSDYTYLDRLVCDILALLWILYRIQSLVGATEALSLRRMRKGELRPIITILLLISNLLAIVYDTMVAKIKYGEGFAVVGNNITSKPKEYWTAEDLRILPITDSLIDFSFAFMTSSLFLFQATWNFIVQSYIKRPFMNSTEFHLYVAYSVLSFASYALLQFVYINDKTQSTTLTFSPYPYRSSPRCSSALVRAQSPCIPSRAPTNTTSAPAETFVLIVFTLVNHFRLRKTLREIDESSRARRRLEVYMRLNLYLGIFIGMMGIPLVIINIDILTGAVIAGNKLVTDLLMKIFNIGFPGVFMFLCMALYPSSDYASCSCTGNRSANRRHTARQYEDSGATSEGPSIRDTKCLQLTESAKYDAV
ncbi:hypothetical protein K493DRAFT_384472 [Basidiobolus meristosporus CBS 931.73]|uniref:G-protein coupled receptors family 1 profile domain-containing protein n=1 Tax=Basidiobolus meristosporus CBS 931.73 TaxID=1314790 RepID=A0A1Y1YYJ9_9FUNG|nr:hypothetical protein K493DRAFT_384472 [Basidiobolus meristosporus CBS 931.73]|eukprot:ORY03102.1 hypothetical protein K493DRAFT_384472 [Basidiobolus meristosporus CBS 931.73]